MHDHLDALAARLGLELVRGAACDDLAVVDDADVVREAVRLLQVLRGEQERRAARHQVLNHVPQRHPVAGVQAGRRLVHEHHRGPHHQCRRQVQAAAHTAGVRLRGAVGGLREVELLQQLPRPGLRRLSAHLVELPDHLEVLPAGQILVHRRELARQAYLAAYLVRVPQHVDPGHDRLAAVRLQQRRQHAHRRGLARAVRTQQPQHRALGHVQVHSVQCAYVSEGLHEAFGIDGARHPVSPVQGLPQRERASQTRYIASTLFPRLRHSPPRCHGPLTVAHELRPVSAPRNPPPEAPPSPPRSARAPSSRAGGRPRPP